MCKKLFFYETLYYKQRRLGDSQLNNLLEKAIFIDRSRQKNRGCRGAQIINRIHYNNFSSLKATMVSTGFADMPREETTLQLMNRSPLQTPRLLFIESLRKNHQQNPPKHFGLREGLHGGLLYPLLYIIFMK